MYFYGIIKMDKTKEEIRMGLIDNIRKTRQEKSDAKIEEIANKMMRKNEKSTGEEITQTDIERAYKKAEKIEKKDRKRKNRRNAIIAVLTTLGITIGGRTCLIN